MTLAHRTHHRQAGSILILVVWAVMLLSILVAGLGSRGAFALGVGQRLGHSLQASYVAVAALPQIGHLLASDLTPSYDGKSEEWGNRKAVFEDQAVGEGSWTIQYVDSDTGEVMHGLIDEERKLNLNLAPQDAFQRLLQSVGGMPPRDAQAVAEALGDWRDKDKQQQPDGAEDFYYLGLSEAYECKDGPFENVEELLLLKGMGLEAYDRMLPYITVHGSGKLNLNTASRSALQALGLSPEGVIGVILYRMGEDNIEGTGDDRVLAAVGSAMLELSSFVPQEDLTRIAANSKWLTVGSEAFRFLVIAKAEGAAYPLRVEGVVNRAGQIREWMEE